MSKTLSEREQGFNDGIAAAIEYHEAKARAADRAAREARGIGDEDYDDTWCFKLIGAMSMHRSFGNALRRLCKLTDAEIAEADRLAERMNR